MTETEYRALDAWNWSTVKEARKSMKHVQYRRSHPREDTSGLMCGRANHTLVFEPDRFDELYAVFPGARRQGKIWEAFEAANVGKTILKADEAAECHAIADAVLHHPIVSTFLAGGRAEEGLTWTDRLTGLPCKGRIDFLSTARPAIIDLKGVPSVNPRIYGATAARLGHHLQGAFYLQGAEACGLGVLPVYIVAVEIAPPHDIGVFEVTDDATYAAEEELRELMQKIKASVETDRWPGRFNAIEPLQLPGWCFPSIEGEASPVEEVEA